MRIEDKFFHYTLGNAAMLEVFYEPLNFETLTEPEAYGPRGVGKRIPPSPSPLSADVQLTNAAMQISQITVRTWLVDNISDIPSDGMSGLNNRLHNDSQDDVAAKTPSFLLGQKRRSMAPGTPSYMNNPYSGHSAPSNDIFASPIPNQLKGDCWRRCFANGFVGVESI
ncbi:hypothetical protein ANCCAN_07917 [Ancylostoma caninum]|uniref:Uncharacterized protein n=1 Tax=Ancylostoma caninum TaxID=29170 RepID=A0A368GNV8_ANCCA|nr:hypothetical protein ANCCAN_07917 [Ancylostoma caninum]